MNSGRADRILLGTLAPAISDQCKRLQILPTEMTLVEIDRINKAINVLWVASMLTERERTNARRRMIKAAAFKDIL